MADGLEIREAGPDELDALVALAGRALGWDDAHPNAVLFQWKHRDNPFGRSAMYVALDGDRPVGLRALMRWDFLLAGERVKAVRAVDTATDPDHQGRGIFRRLTEQAVATEAEADVGFVFNTPNEQSRPGYLKMGWQVAGVVPTWVRPLGPAAPLRMIRSRQPAQKWSLATDAGEDPADALTDDFAHHLLAHPTPTDLLTTARDGPFLRWRYGLGELHYRVIRNDDAAVVFRRRRRGDAIELAVTDVLGSSSSARRAVMRQLRSSVEADYLLAAGRRPDGVMRLPGQGPTLTTRRLARPAPLLEEFSLTLGDLELF